MCSCKSFMLFSFMWVAAASLKLAGLAEADHNFFFQITTFGAVDGSTHFNTNVWMGWHSVEWKFTPDHTHSNCNQLKPVGELEFRRRNCAYKRPGWMFGSQSWGVAVAGVRRVLLLGCWCKPLKLAMTLGMMFRYTFNCLSLGVSFSIRYLV